MSIRFIKMSVVYFVAAVTVGLFMAASNDHTLAGAHAHLALLGWASMALAGLLYREFPKAGESRLAAAHFWLAALSLPVMLVSLGFYLYGRQAALPAVIAGSNLFALSVLIFAANVLINAA